MIIIQLKISRSSWLPKDAGGDDEHDNKMWINSVGADDEPGARNPSNVRMLGHGQHPPTEGRGQDQQGGEFRDDQKCCQTTL